MITLIITLGSTALAFDHEHAAFAPVLQGAVDESGVDYALLATRRPALDAYLATLAAAPVSTFERDQQLAFWINAYNAITLTVVLDALPIGSIMELDGGQVWKTRSFEVGGERLTLDAIEQQRVRPLGDARAHAALNCASQGCPPLPPTPLQGAALDAQLDAASRAWVASNAVVIADGAIAVSEIFKWYAADFTSYRVVDLPQADDAQDAALQFAVRFASTERAAALTAGALPVRWAPYDWALNSR